MCGFIGKISFDERPDLEKGKRALHSIKHRGPDNSDSWSDNKHIFLGHQRLSIIDVTDNANQPMHSNNKKVTIVFNGEIYNYKKLHKYITKEIMKTQSDTEVILNGYLEEGAQFFKRLRGIYSFAIIDRRKKIKVILARDPAGVKPLYISYDKNNIIFGSEIKSIKIISNRQYRTNKLALKQYFNLGFVPEPNTIYREINALEPGNLMIWSYNKKISNQSFFKYNYEEFNNYSFKENVYYTQQKMKKAVTRNLVSDVEISLALSGGIDSSLIYAYSRENNFNIKAKTISFSASKNYDESKISESYVKKIPGNHEIIKIDKNINLELINKVFLHFDQPFADSSAIPLYLINKHISKKNKVIIGGDGGDELFNGYPSQYYLKIVKSLNHNPRLWNLLSYFKELLPSTRRRQFDRIEGLFSNKDDLEIIYNKHSWMPQNTSINGITAFKNPFDKKHFNDYKSLFDAEKPRSFESIIIFDYFRKLMLSDYLRKVDMMSMLNGVEWRVPMLDEDLSSFAFSIPFKQKSTFTKTKRHLRSLHNKIYNGMNSFKPKKGFSIPLDKYLNINDKKEMVNEILKKDTIVDEYFNREYIRKISSLFIECNDDRVISRESLYQRILMLYNLKIWSNLN